MCVPAFNRQTPVVLMTINDDDVDELDHYDGVNDVRIGGGDVKDEEVVPDKSCPLH